MEDAEIISIYPNPFDEQTTVRTRIDLEWARMVICDGMGNTLKEKLLYVDAGRRIILFREDLPDGIYCVQIENDRGLVYTGKLIIAKG